jgi:hypothetical protein
MAGWGLCVEKDPGRRRDYPRTRHNHQCPNHKAAEAAPAKHLEKELF